MTAETPNPENTASPTDDTLVPGKESPARKDEAEGSGYRNQTRPLPVDPGSAPSFHQPAFGAPEPPRRPVPVCCWVAVVSSLTSVVLAVLLWVRTPPAAVPAAAAAPNVTAPAAAQPAPPAEAAPAALKPYLAAAQAGDTNAMRMLGTMYYHGLDLPRNREEGLKWYRKAAASGSKVAQDELKQLE
jgi:hypothetical protein